MLQSLLSKKSNQETRKAYDIALKYLKMVRNEIRESDKLYGKDAASRLRQYYQSIAKSGADFEFFSHYYSERVKNLVLKIAPGRKILDAGCGLGSESILCAILGGDVTGIDISDRLNESAERVKYYEKKLRKNLHVRFIKESIFDHLGEYDLIWVNEAISHIDPVDKFFRLVHKNLKIGGFLLIADSNKLNPLILLRSKKEQKFYGGRIIHELDPKTHQKISYAIERIFTTFAIRNLLSQIFKVTKLEIFGFFPSFIFNKIKSLAIILENKILRNLPLIKHLGGTYIIECKKTN